MFRSLRLYAHAAVLGLLALGSVGHAQTASPHNQNPEIKADLIVGGMMRKTLNSLGSGCASHSGLAGRRIGNLRAMAVFRRNSTGQNRQT